MITETQKEEATNYALKILGATEKKKNENEMFPIPISRLRLLCNAVRAAWFTSPASSAPAIVDDREPLSRPQKRVLEAAAAHIAQHNTAPSMADLCLALGYRSKNGVRSVILKLEKAGYIKRVGKQKKIKLV